MNWLCRIFGHRLNTGSGPSAGHWCARSWGRGQWASDCTWCDCKQHGCTDCHGRDYIPPPAYLWCVQRGGTGQYLSKTQSIGWPLPSPLSVSQLAYLKDFRARYPVQLHPDVQKAIDALEAA